MPKSAIKTPNYSGLNKKSVRNYYYNMFVSKNDLFWSKCIYRIFISPNTNLYSETTLNNAHLPDHFVFDCRIIIFALELVSKDI